MSTLLIIDIQETYRKACRQLIDSIPEIFKNYSKICYLWDDGDGSELFSQVPEEWLYSTDEENDDDTVYNKIHHTFSKQYGFFRDFMDSINLGYPEEDIVLFGKFMISKGITDSRDILEDENLCNDALDFFKDNSNLTNFVKSKDSMNTYIMTMPYDLIEELRKGNNYTLVGGGVNECLAEVRLLMEMIDIDYTILYEYTY